MHITFEMTRRPIFNESIRAMMARIPEGSDLVAVSEEFSFQDVSRQHVAQSAGSAYVRKDGLITTSTLYYPPCEDALIFGAPWYFAAFGNEKLEAAAQERIAEMDGVKSHRHTYATYATRFGLMILTENPFLEMVFDAKQTKFDHITQKVARSNIGLITDSDLSNHEHCKAISAANELLHEVLVSTFAPRSDKEKWQPWFDDFSFEVVPGKD